MIILKGYKLERIELYPCGGCSKFNSLINIPLTDEFLILISGPIFQILGFLALKSFISYRDLNILKSYNTLILIFNFLPIYPLDGGKLIHLIFSKLVSFKNSLLITFYLSFISIFIVLYLSLRYIKSLLFLIVLIFLYTKFVKETLQFSIYYHKFILERYLYDFSYLPLKKVKSIKNFKKNRYHQIKYHNKYIFEKEYLKNFFINLNEERRVL